MTSVHNKPSKKDAEGLRKEYLREISRYKSFRLPHLFYEYMRAMQKWRQLKFRRTYRGAVAASKAITQMRKCATELRDGIKKYRELRRKLANTPTTVVSGAERRST